MGHYSKNAKSPVTDLREIYGLTKQQAAILLGLAASTVARIELGLTDIPEKCRPIIESLGLDFEEMCKRQSRYRELVRQGTFDLVRDKLRNK